MRIREGIQRQYQSNSTIAPISTAEIPFSECPDWTEPLLEPKYANPLPFVDQIICSKVGVQVEFAHQLGVGLKGMVDQRGFYAPNTFKARRSFVNTVFRKVSFISVTYANGVIRATNWHESVDNRPPNYPVAANNVGIVQKTRYF